MDQSRYGTPQNVPPIVHLPQTAPGWGGQCSSFCRQLDSHIREKYEARRWWSDPSLDDAAIQALARSWADAAVCLHTVPPGLFLLQEGKNLFGIIPHPPCSPPPLCFINICSPSPVWPMGFLNEPDHEPPITVMLCPLLINHIRIHCNANPCTTSYPPPPQTPTPGLNRNSKTLCKGEYASSIIFIFLHELFVSIASFAFLIISGKCAKNANYVHLCAFFLLSCIFCGCLGNLLFHRHPEVARTIFLNIF